MPERQLRVLGAPVVVVEAERLLEPGLVRRPRDRDHRGVQVRHVVAADDVGGVRQAARVLVARRAQQQRGGVDRAAGRPRRRPRCRPPRCRARSTTTRLTERPDASGSSRVTRAWVRSVTLGCLSAGRTHSTCASALPSVRQGNPSKRSQRMQRPASGSDSSRSTPTGRWNGRWPALTRSSCSCWIRGSWETAG